MSYVVRKSNGFESRISSQPSRVGNQIVHTNEEVPRTTRKHPQRDRQQGYHEEIRHVIRYIDPALNHDSSYPLASAEEIGIDSLPAENPSESSRERGWRSGR